MRQFEIFELVYPGEEPSGSGVEIDLKAVFTVEGNSMEVQGFYAGNHQYKIRFYPAKAGLYTYTVTGIVSDRGQIECESALQSVSNEIQNHGMVHEKECTSIGILNLPEGRKYRIEVIDTWEMTRKVSAENVSGLVKVNLPGKEGMAILATAM